MQMMNANRVSIIKSAGAAFDELLDGESLASSWGRPMEEFASRVRVFVYEDVSFAGTRLSTIVGDAGYALIEVRVGVGIDATLDSLLPPPELMIVPAACNGDRVLEAVRSRPWLRVVPILAIGSPDPSGVDLWRLRGFGVVGLIDRRATAEHVRFRIDELIEARSCGPRDARAPCCFLVDVEAAGAVTTEYALSFSLGGIGLASIRAFEPNTEVRLKLALTTSPGALVVVDGRVVRSVARADGRHDVGIVFLPLRAEVGASIRDEIRALLLATGLQLGNLSQAAPDCSVEYGALSPIEAS